MLFISKSLLNLLFIFFAVSHQQSDAADFGVDFRILRGVPEPIQDRPYVASVFDFDHQKLIGTGTVLSVNFVITAAHLFSKKPNNETTYDKVNTAIRVGSTFSGSDGKVHFVEQIFYHPKMTSSREYDVALIKVILPFTLTDNVHAKPLQSDINDVSVGTTCVLAGFGETLNEAEDKDEPRLRVSAIQILDATHCSGTYKKFWPKDGKMLCAGIQNIESGACPGDHGAPLVCNNKLFAIFSFGLCKIEQANYGAYVLIPHIRDFIKETAGI